MAGPYSRQNPCWNLPPTGKDEVAGAAARPTLTNDNKTLIYTLAVSYVPTPASAPPLTPAKLVVKYTNADL